MRSQMRIIRIQELVTILPNTEAGTSKFFNLLDLRGADRK